MDTTSSSGTHEESGSGTGGSSGGTGSSSGTSSGSSSSGVAEHCGDGLVDPAADEECDDGDDNGDARRCSNACKKERVIFVTSQAFPATALSGSKADDWCQVLAEEGKTMGALPPNNALYRAWLSTSDQPAANRHDHGRHRYVDSRGTPVAASWDDLVQGNLMNPIAHDELQKGPFIGYVWTGTGANGTPTTDNCADWTTTEETVRATVGVSDAVGVPWTDEGTRSCAWAIPLYCLEQGTP